MRQNSPLGSPEYVVEGRAVLLDGDCLHGDCLHGDCCGVAASVTVDDHTLALIIEPQTARRRNAR